MGVGWDKERTAGFLGTGAPDVDLDASAVQFTGDQLFDLAFYNNLATRDGSVVHLGDNLTGGGEGDDEVITVDLSKVYAKVDTIAFLVSSYQGHVARVGRQRLLPGRRRRGQRAGPLPAHRRRTRDRPGDGDAGPLRRRVEAARDRRGDRREGAHRVGQALQPYL